MIFIDYKDTRPIYEQVVEKIKTLILKGVFKPDTQLQSVRSLAAELSINPNTIQKAYTELERQGFIYMVKGRGAFVRYDQSHLDMKKREIVERIEVILQEGAELGFSREELLLEVASSVADKKTSSESQMQNKEEEHD